MGKFQSSLFKVDTQKADVAKEKDTIITRYCAEVAANWLHTAMGGMVTAGNALQGPRGVSFVSWRSDCSKKSSKTTVRATLGLSPLFCIIKPVIHREQVRYLAPALVAEADFALISDPT